MIHSNREIKNLSETPTFASEHLKVLYLGLRTEDLGLRTNDLSLRTNVSGLRTNDSGLQTVDLCIRTEDLGLKTEDLGLRTNYLSLQTEDLGLWTFILYVLSIKRNYLVESWKNKANLYCMKTITKKEASLRKPHII